MTAVLTRSEQTLPGGDENRDTYRPETGAHWPDGDTADQTRWPGLDELQIDVHSNAETALDAWKQLEAVANASVYQTSRFALPWLETIGVAAAMRPMIITVRDQDANLLALLPLCVTKKAGITIAEFIGGRDSNANMALVRPGLSFDAATVMHILREAARKSDQSVDLYKLINQPRAWEGISNPLGQLPAQDSPSQCHSTQLQSDPEAHRNQRLNKDIRKKLRAKTRKLGEIGELRFLRARTRGDAERILNAFYAQKNQRFAEKNITHTFDTPQSRNFLQQTCVETIDQPDHAIELYALICGEQIIATYAGGIHNGRFHGMFNSFDQSQAFSRFSPGDVLLNMLIEAKCLQGLQTFDLGIGEARYKQSWCEHAEPLFDSMIGITFKGRSYGLAMASSQKIKRVIKQSRWAWPLITKLRQVLRVTRA